MKFEDYTRTLKAHTRYQNAAGRRIPGVTTILKNIGWNTDVLVNWAKRTAAEGLDPDRIRDASAALGTTAHYLVECWATDSEPDLKEVAPIHLQFALAAFDNFKQWADAYECTPYGTEIPVISERYQYGGTVDLVADVGGVRTLLDFKTSKGVYAEHKIQVAAYAMAYNEEHPAEPIMALCVLQLGRERGDFTAHAVTDKEWEVGQEAFVRALDLHQYRKALR